MVVITKNYFPIEELEEMFENQIWKMIGGESLWAEILDKKDIVGDDVWYYLYNKYR